MLRNPATWAMVDGLARALLDRTRIHSVEARRVMRQTVADAVARRGAPSISAA